MLTTRGDASARGGRDRLVSFTLAFSLLWTDKIDDKGPDSVDLQNRIALALREVPHLRLRREEPTQGHVFQGCIVPFRSHPHGCRALDHRDVLPCRMPMWRDLRSVGTRQPQSISGSCLHRIALEDGNAQCP